MKDRDVDLSGPFEGCLAKINDYYIRGVSLPLLMVL